MSRGSSRSLHNSMRAAFTVVLMGSVHLMKLFRDFRRDYVKGALYRIWCGVNRLGDSGEKVV